MQTGPLVGETRWSGGSFDEAATRIRVATLLRNREQASWEVLDFARGRRLAGESVVDWKTVGLGWASAPLCLYAAVRTGKLHADEPLICRGDRDVPGGHGRLTALSALAKGCRSFVQQVAVRLTWADYQLAARLFRMDGALGPRPNDQMARWRLFAEGVGVRLTLPQARLFALAAARSDPGDPARTLVRTGALEAVRSGYAQAAGVAGLDVSLIGGACRPGAEEQFLLAWSPFGKPRFVVVVHHRQSLDQGMSLVRRVFNVLAG